MTLDNESDAYNVKEHIKKSGDELADEVETCRQSLLKDPGNISLHVQLGNAFSDLGGYTNAVAEYVEASRLQPDLPVLHFNLGMLC